MSEAPTPVRRFRRAVARLPFTIALAVALLAVAAATGTLLQPARHEPWFEQVASGLPALADGLWWTPLTAAFIVSAPPMLFFAIPSIFVGVGLAEWRFGSLRTAGVFVAGQLIGVLGAAAIVAALVPTNLHWAQRLTEAYSVGPSCGALACLAFALASLPSPWRLRGRFILGAWAGIGVLYIGSLGTIEHAVAVAAALAVSGALPAFRHPAGRPTAREWRVLAFGGLLIIGAVEVIDLAVPYNGPLGQNTPTASFFDVAIDVVVIALIANGVRMGLRLAWWIAIVFAGFNILTALFGIALVPFLIEAEIIGHPYEVFGLVLAPAVLWGGELVVLLAGRSSFSVRLRRSRRAFAGHALTRAEALDRLRELGGGNISWMIGWPGNRHIAAGSGTIAYQTHAGVAIALGDPVVPAAEIGEALRAFARSAEHAGFVPCVFSAGPASAEHRPSGWRSAVIAEDTIVDLPDLAFTGKRWNSVRTSINKAEREGIAFRMCTLADEPWSVLAQVRAISEQWSGDKGLPEMRFTLGTVDEARDPETRVGIAVDADGSLHGITSWLPVYGPGGRVRGWTLDLMRRRDDGFGPVMEFLIAESAKHFSEQGYEFVSLSGAPLVRPELEEPGPVDFALDRISETLEPLYGFRSLHRFKQKFHPRAEPLHLLYRDEGDLPRIALALTRAYLPDTTVRELAASAAGALTPEEKRP